jgi:hypothetical protein
VVKDVDGNPRTGTVGITFTLHKDSQTSASLWIETQNVQLDATGHYTALLGATDPEGVPLALFTSGVAHWLGVHVQGVPDQPRVLLVSVPYAMKAHDADTLGGMPASAFTLRSASTTTAASTAASTSSAGALAVTTSGGFATSVPKFDSRSDIVPSAIREIGGSVSVSAAGSNLFLNGTGDHRLEFVGSTTAFVGTLNGQALFGSNTPGAPLSFFVTTPAGTSQGDGKPLEAVHVTGGGRIGVGTNSPTARLHLVARSPSAYAPTEADTALLQVDSQPELPLTSDLIRVRTANPANKKLAEVFTVDYFGITTIGYPNGGYGGGLRGNGGLGIGPAAFIAGNNYVAGNDPASILSAALAVIGGEAARYDFSDAPGSGVVVYGGSSTNFGQFGGDGIVTSGGGGPGGAGAAARFIGGGGNDILIGDPGCTGSEQFFSAIGFGVRGYPSELQTCSNYSILNEQISGDLTFNRNAGGYFSFQENATGSQLVIAPGGHVGVATGKIVPANIFTIGQGQGHAISDGWDTYSSARWKTNIQTLHGALAKVVQLRGVSYDYTPAQKHDIGMIAEEVGKVVPEVVTYEDNGKDARSIDYARLTAVLVEAVKDQQKEIAQQHRAITQQQAQIRKLEAKVASLTEKK